jgi:DNA invertase Pin-like site-specific DNA recombinase
MAKRAGLYTRISQDRSGEKAGVGRQEQLCRELAAKLGFEVIEVYCDDDVSAYSGATRPQYERLLADVEDGHLDAILSWHIDRLYRSPKDLERLIDVIEKFGCEVRTVLSGDLDLSTAHGRAQARFGGVIARLESERLGERVRAAKIERRAKGLYMGGARPFGFTDSGFFDPHPVEAPAIRKAAHDLLAGASLHAVARQWNAQGLRTTRRQKAWQPDAIRALFRNKSLSHLIDADVLAAVRALLADPGRQPPNHTWTAKLVGAGIFLCGRCGGRLYSGGTNLGVARYGCREGMAMSPPHTLYRRADHVDTYVERYVAKRLDRENVALLPRRDDTAPLYAEQDRLQARSQMLARLVATGGMSEHQFVIANTELQRELQLVDTKIGRINATSALSGIADAVTPGLAFLEQPLDRRRAVLRSLVQVTLLPGRPRYPGGLSFHPDSVKIEDLDALR